MNKKFSGFIKTLSLFTTFGTLIQTIPYNVLASAGNSDEDIMLILENLGQGNTFENFKKLQTLLETGVIDKAIESKNIGINDVDIQYQDLASFLKIANQLEQNILDEESVNDFNSKSDQYKDMAKNLKNTIIDLGTQAVMDKAIKSTNIATVDKKVNEDVASVIKTALLNANDPQGSAITIIANVNGDTTSSNSFIATKVGNLVEVAGKGLTNFSSESSSNIASTVSDFSQSVSVNNVAKAVVEQIDDKVDSKFNDVLVNELSYSFEKNGVRNLSGNISDLIQNAINMYNSMQKLNYDVEKVSHEQIQKDLQPELNSMNTAIENFVKQSYESSFSEQVQNVSDNINSVQENLLELNKKIENINSEDSNYNEIKDSIDAISEQLKNAKNECSKYNGNNSEFDGIKSGIEDLEKQIQDIQKSYNDTHDIKEFNERISSVQKEIRDISNNIMVLATVEAPSAPSVSDQAPSGSSQDSLSSAQVSSSEIKQVVERVIKNLTESVERGDCIPVKKNNGKIEYTVVSPSQKASLATSYQELQKSQEALKTTFGQQNKPKVLTIDEINDLQSNEGSLREIETQIENHKKIKTYLENQKAYNESVIQEMNNNINDKVKKGIEQQYSGFITIDTAKLTSSLQEQAKFRYQDIEGYLEIVDFTCGKDNVKWQLDSAIEKIDENIDFLRGIRQFKKTQNQKKNVDAETFNIDEYIECLTQVKGAIERKYGNISPLSIIDRWTKKTMDKAGKTVEEITIKKGVTVKEIDRVAEVLETYNIIKYNLSVAEQYKKLYLKASGSNPKSVPVKFKYDVLKAMYDLDKERECFNKLKGYIKTNLEYQKTFPESEYSNMDFMDTFNKLMDGQFGINLKKKLQDNRKVEDIEQRISKNKKTVITDFLTVSKIGASIGYFYDAIEENDNDILIQYNELSEQYTEVLTKEQALDLFKGVLTRQLGPGKYVFGLIDKQENKYQLTDEGEKQINQDKDKFKKIINNLDYYYTAEERQKNIDNDLKLLDFKRINKDERMGRIECFYNYMKAQIETDPYKTKLDNMISNFKAKNIKDVINGIIKDSFELVQKDTNENDSMENLMNLINKYYENIVEDTIENAKKQESQIINTASETPPAATGIPAPPPVSGIPAPPAATGIPAPPPVSGIPAPPPVSGIPAPPAATGIPAPPPSFLSPINAGKFPLKKIKQSAQKSTTATASATANFQTIQEVNCDFRTDLNKNIAALRNQLLILNKKSTYQQRKDDFNNLFKAETPNSTICAIKQVLNFANISSEANITLNNYSNIFVDKRNQKQFNTIGISEKEECVKLVRSIYRTYNECISQQNELYTNLGKLLNDKTKRETYHQTFETTKQHIEELNTKLSNKKEDDKSTTINALTTTIDAFITKNDNANKFVYPTNDKLYKLLSGKDKEEVNKSIKKLEEIRQKYNSNSVQVNADNVKKDLQTVQDTIITVNEKLYSQVKVDDIQKELTDIVTIFEGLSNASKYEFRGTPYQETTMGYYVNIVDSIIKAIKQLDKLNSTEKEKQTTAIKKQYSQYSLYMPAMKNKIQELKQKDSETKKQKNRKYQENKDKLEKVSKNINNMIQLHQYNIVKYVKYQYKDIKNQSVDFKTYNDAVFNLLHNVKTLYDEVKQKWEDAQNNKTSVLVYNELYDKQYEEYNKDIEQWFNMINGTQFNGNNLTTTTKIDIKPDDINRLNKKLISKYAEEKELDKEIAKIQSALQSAQNGNIFGNTGSTQTQNGNIFGNTGIFTDHELEILNGEEQQNLQPQTQVINEKTKAQIISNLSNLMDTYCLDSIINFLKSGNQTEANKVIATMNKAKTAICSNNISEIKNAVNDVLTYRLKYIENYIPYYSAKNLASTILADNYASNLSKDDLKRSIIIDFLYSRYAIDNNFDFAKCINSDNILILIQSLGKQLYSHGYVKQADIFDSILYKDEAKTQIDKDGIYNMNLAAVVMRMMDSDENSKTLMNYTLDDLMNEFKKIG